MAHHELSTSFVGAKLRSCIVRLMPRQTMNFAAGIFDDSACYFDDLRPEGIVAHPMQICSLTWQMSSRFGEYLVADGFPTELSRQQVHYTETVFWHRAMRPGDELTIDGHIAAILPHRAGTHLVVQYQALNSENQPVFTEYTGALLRGVQCVVSDQEKDIPPPGLPLPSSPLPRGSLPTGSSLPAGINTQSISGSDTALPGVLPLLWECERQLHPLAAHLYDGCAEISFPIHSSPAFAKSVGLPGIIMQGTATASMAVSELIRREASGDPRLISRMDCRFAGMVFPGSKILIRLHQREQTAQGCNLVWSVTDEHGRVAIGDGSLLIKEEN